MPIKESIKRFLFSSFREVFLYHHNSLEFRAKLFALIISANKKHSCCEKDLVLEAGFSIYKDKDRAKALEILTYELIKKVEDNNGLDIDKLIDELLNSLKDIPRYHKKINTLQLLPIAECCKDKDSKIYQLRIIEFLEKTKSEYANR